MTKNRHELPRKRPGRNKQDEIAEDLPTLEPLIDEGGAAATDDLPVLEPVEEPAADGPVKIACTSSGEAGFDLVLTCDVAAMEKKLVPIAVEGPLRRAVAAAADKFRHQRVLVRFTGEAMIGSAVKELVAETMKAHRPVLVVVRRGFGDETVVQGKLPEVGVTIAENDGVTRVDVGTGEVDGQDIAAAFAPHLQRLVATARGRKFAFAFTGKHKPDSTLRARLTAALQEAGAVRATIGERVLFDRELADRVQCSVSGDVMTIAVKPADDDASTINALSLVLPGFATKCAGRDVRVALAKAAPVARDFCVDFARQHGASRISVGDDVVWPPVATLVPGAELVLRAAAHGRSRPQVLAALRAEAGTHAGATKGKAVVVDWPAGWQLDAESDACVRDLATALAARTVSCTVGGEQREPFWPEPVQIADGAVTVVRLDSEAGKPVELQRAIDRRLASRAMGLRGKAVRIQITGGVALSRTLLRAVVGMVQAAGVSRLEVEEAGGIDVLLPALLTVAKSGDGVRITALPEGHDAAQQPKALSRELDAAQLPPGATVTLVPSPLTDALVAALAGKGVARVVIDSAPPVLAHPPLLVAADKKAMSVRVVVQAGNDAAMVERQLDRELAAFIAGLALLATSTVTIVWSGGDPAGAPAQKLIAAIAARRTSKVLFDRGDGKPQQVHPASAATSAVAAPAAPGPAAASAPSAAPAAAVTAAPAPSGPAAVPATSPGGSLLTLLARRDDAVPPMIVLGVAAGSDAAHLAAVDAELQGHLARFRGRSVLLVLRGGDRDVPVRKPEPLVDLLRAAVSTTAAATLVFRGPDAAGRPHFQVLHSSLRGLPVGGTFADPRARA